LKNEEKQKTHFCFSCSEKSRDGLIQSFQKRKRIGIVFSSLFSLSAAQAELLPAQGGLSDPTRPPDYQEAGIGIGTTPQWVLKSILISPTRRSAILNGRVVKQGERLDQEMTVLDILPGSVVLKGAEGEFSVNLLPVSVKMPGKIGNSAP
jgi:hypothetical protein